MKKNRLKLVAPICPSNNHYLDYKVMKRGRKNIVFPYPTNETKEFKKNFIAYIQNEVKKQGWVMDESGLQHYYVNWNVYFPRVDMDAQLIILVFLTMQHSCVSLKINVRHVIDMVETAHY